MAGIPPSESRRYQTTISLVVDDRKLYQVTRPRRILASALVSAFFWAYILIAFGARIPFVAGERSNRGFADTGFPPTEDEYTDDLDYVSVGAIPRMQLFDTKTPLLQEKCGSWVTAYADLHAKILNSELPPRYAVYVPFDAGLADWLSGIVTGFLYALLTGRAFQIHNPQGLADLSLAFDSPFINWTAPAYTFRYEDFYQPDCDRDRHDNNTYGCWTYLNVDDDNHILKEQELTNFPNNATHVFFVSNRGYSFRLFENSHHTQQLLNLGLTPRTAFGCVFQFLFRARPELWGLVSERAIKLADPTALVIGINVRTGDYAYRLRSDGLVERHSVFFNCAAQIERTRAAPGQKVVWLLTSDSLELRRQAKLHYGSKLVTDTERRALHIGCFPAVREDCGASDHATNSLQRAASDLLLLAAADFHVIPAWSGFAQKAAWLASSEDGHIYTIYDMNTICGEDEYTRAPEFVRLWSGI